MKNKVTLTIHEVLMYRSRRFVVSERLMSLWLKKLICSSLILVCAISTMVAQQDVQRGQPVWWYGASGALNFNFYYGTTQMLNAAITSPGPFHKGDGTGFNAALLLEYRPDPVWGGILQVGYDDRRGSFDGIISPCNDCPEALFTSPTYITVEPSLRIAPFSSGFYLFVGPTFSFNAGKDFTYTHQGNPGFQATDTWSDMRAMVFSAQAGIGLDIPLSSENAETQVNLSPFVSFSPDFHGPRSVESWRVNVLRAGASLKFGSGDIIPRPVVPPPVVAQGDVQFSIRAPKAIPVQRKVRETFPMRNYVFFDEGSSEVPNRYVALTADQASRFREDQLQLVEPASMTGRSRRQLVLYYNILNILGDRLRSSPGASITLRGSSAKGPAEGQAFAESIKRYLVTVFGIDGSRIVTVGLDKPLAPSEQPGGTRELTLLRAEDRRVAIGSSSPELLLQVGGPPDELKPTQIVVVHEDPLDSHVLFNVAGARDVLSSWSLEVRDERGSVQRFGPFTRDRESVPGRSILGTRAEGNYKVVMLGNSKSGRSVRKEGSVHLVRRDEEESEALRFSILFDFGTSETVERHLTFLTDMVAPLIPDGGTVIIHGHTDIIGDDEFNQTLSYERATAAQAILERAVARRGTSGVTFETYGFGEDSRYTVFENNTPEERSYNRNVIIDIIAPAK
jgi:outer membrane protein OmpA-like peptidoglycan-associated protein